MHAGLDELLRRVGQLQISSALVVIDDRGPNRLTGWAGALGAVNLDNGRPAALDPETRGYLSEISRCDIGGYSDDASRDRAHRLLRIVYVAQEHVIDPHGERCRCFRGLRLSRWPDEDSRRDGRRRAAGTSRGPRCAGGLRDLRAGVDGHRRPHRPDSSRRHLARKYRGLTALCCRCRPAGPRHHRHVPGRPAPGTPRCR